MEINQDFAFTTKEGHQYLIKFLQLSRDIIPGLISIPVVDVAIELVIPTPQTNNAKTLFQIAACIKNYIDHHDVILYCYCDSAPISKRNPNLLNQEFRSMLFVKMFEKQDNKDYINEKIVIEDIVNGNHYIHLFSHVHNKGFIDVIASNLQEFNK